MLRRETVSDSLAQVLTELMELEELQNHRLVGGTALALQIGHRKSVDIDLFSGDSSDYSGIETAIRNRFGKRAQILHYIHSPLGRGINLSIDSIKTDLIDWNRRFLFPEVREEGVRLASMLEIALMKLGILTGPPEWIRYEKKDFVDLAFIFQHFPLSELIPLFQAKEESVGLAERRVLEALESAELADKKPHPFMLLPMDWAETKNQIGKAIRLYLEEKGA